MARSNDVWVFLEPEDDRLAAHTERLLHEGKRLSDATGGNLSAILLGPDVAKLNETVGACGAERLYRHRDARLARPSPELCAALLCTLARKYRPRLLLAAASSLGSDVMPRVAASIDAPLVTNCLEVQVGDEIAFKKAVQSGRLQATIAAQTRGTCLATLDLDALPAAEAAVSSKALEVCEIDATLTDIPERLRVTDIIKADPKTVDIREAEVVVAIGNGIGPRENLDAYENFAALIGAAIGGSRPVIDSGILAHERQVGQTGRKISPKLAVLCGISGSEYFTKGIEQARTKIAINTDRSAPIFKDVDLGIVADVNTLIPKLMDHLNRHAKDDAS